MEPNVSNSNQQKNDLAQRLEEIRLSDYERLSARAHLARAEALAAGFAWMVQAVRRLFRAPARRAPRGVAPSAG